MIGSLNKREMQLIEIDILIEMDKICREKRVMLLEGEGDKLILTEEIVEPPKYNASNKTKVKLTDEIKAGRKSTIITTNLSFERGMKYLKIQ